MKISRLEAVCDFVNEKGMVSLDDLRQEFGVSMSTLRRDINVLCERGDLKKMYGFVTRNTDTEEAQLFHPRSAIHTEAKRKAAGIAARFINDNDVIFIDSGSTCCLIIDFLKDRKNVTIITNNLDVILHSKPYPNLDVYVLPGLYKRQNNSFSMLTDDELYNNYNIRKAFLASSGVTLSNGVAHSDLSERIIKRSAINKTREKYLLLDHAKFNKDAPLYLCDITEFTAICTDRRPPEDYVVYLNKNGVQLYYD
ncbi:MAG: DeoR/GlpR family DNA-binding transcription regulator [Christensenellales bacterium]|jgi:DeoR family myo-inositol catabolism operon transcriptional repressor